jgi:hypothetical protein
VFQMSPPASILDSNRPAEIPPNRSKPGEMQEMPILSEILQISPLGNARELRSCIRSIPENICVGTLIRSVDKGFFSPCHGEVF